MATLGYGLGELAMVYAVGKSATAGHGGFIAGAFGNKPAPGPPKAPLMPDQQTVLQDQRLKEAQAAAARAGRASTILTTNASTGDRLGP